MKRAVLVPFNFKIKLIPTVWFQNSNWHCYWYLCHWFWSYFYKGKSNFLKVTILVKRWDAHPWQRKSWWLLPYLLHLNFYMAGVVWRNMTVPRGKLLPVARGKLHTTQDLVVWLSCPFPSSTTSLPTAGSRKVSLSPKSAAWVNCLRHHKWESPACVCSEGLRAGETEWSREIVEVYINTFSISYLPPAPNRQLRALLTTWPSIW